MSQKVLTYSNFIWNKCKSSDRRNKTSRRKCKNKKKALRYIKIIEVY